MDMEKLASRYNTSLQLVQTIRCFHLDTHCWSGSDIEECIQTLLCLPGNDVVLMDTEELKSKYSLDSFSNRVIETSSMAIQVDQINENVNLSDEENELVERLKRDVRTGVRLHSLNVVFQMVFSEKWNSYVSNTASPNRADDDYESEMSESYRATSNAISMAMVGGRRVRGRPCLFRSRVI